MKFGSEIIQLCQDEKWFFEQAENFKKSKSP